MTTSINNDRIIACCGLDCNACPAYTATRAGDEKRIREIAANWATVYNMDVKAESVWCDGCTLPGRKCGHCAECEIRSCATEKGQANCGHCAELSTCDKIQNFMRLAPQIKPVLEEIAEKRG